MHIFDIIALFIFLSGVFIFINLHYLKLPSSVGLIILSLTLSAGLLIYSKIVPEFATNVKHVMENMDYEPVLFEIVLSFMLFAGALNVDFSKLGKSKAPTIVLAIVGVLISTSLVGWVMHYVLLWIGIELSLLHCLVFGALISPTDPVAVIKTIKQYGMSQSLADKMKGESLLNNSVSVVLAVLLHHLAFAHETPSFSNLDYITISSQFIFGGAVIGVILGLIGYQLLLIIDNEDVDVEVLITIALVMVATQVSNYFDVSPVMAITLIGLIIGNKGRKVNGEGAAGEYVYSFWYLIEESLNVMLFVLIGLEMIVLDLRLDVFAAGFFAVIIVIAARWLSVLVPIKISKSSRKSFDNSTINVLAWGGLRSGLSVVLSLSLPDFEGKEIIITLTYVVVVVSLLYQGLTISGLLKSTFGRATE
ncbi:MAG: CPA1 family monovalent cation:H+ antiporter [Parvicellaceae bacterium]|jgi:CPA1 family monovalent cation:H+ antiporter